MIFTLFLSVTDSSQGFELFNSKLDPIESQLNTQEQSLAKILMDTIVNGQLTPKEFFENSFYYFQNNKIPETIAEQIEYLQENRFIENSKGLDDSKIVSQKSSK